MTRNIPQQILIGVPVVVLAIAAVFVAPAWASPWITAVSAYAVFLGHYRNWRGPLTQSEIDRHLAGFDSETTDTRALRTFLEADRGREFFMLNLIEFPKGQVPHPDTGHPMPPEKLVELYSGPFVKKLMQRGGHPLLLMHRRGGDVDSWGHTAETGTRWPLTNIMRYRSRRDFLELCTDPSFENIHRFKRDAISETISFPNGLLMAGFAGPRVFVPLVLALCAALANIVIMGLG